MPSTFTFHLIANAHLDPVWLWDWREGLNEGLITVRTILDLMDEDPELTFIRGEAAIYQHIERTDPATFRRILRYVKQGRWDVVGGTWIQPDTNLPATETLARHFMRGQRYFISRFGKPVRVAWAADSFGHTAGLPEILAAAGIRGFAFTRPNPWKVPLPKPAFWWVGPGGSRVMGYRPRAGWYGCERDEIPRLLDRYLADAQKLDLENVGVFYGMGNHGGGPTRRHLAEIRAWARAHPEVRVVQSGLHRLFDALYEEVERKGDDFLPSHDGELNFCLRGCYSSVARFKFAYRRAEAAVGRAENADAVISTAIGRKPTEMGEAWDAVLFNSFHDILPGSSIERACDDQLAWLGSAVHQSQRVELDAMGALAAQIDTRAKRPAGDYPSAVCAVLFNPHPFAFDGPLEIEASLDYRPIWPYRNKVDQLPIRVLNHAGRPHPFQRIATEHSAMRDFPWRSRVVVPASIPAFGWTLFEFGWVEGAAAPPAPEIPASAPEAGVIDNGIYRIEARVGDEGIRVLHHGRPVFGDGGLSAAVFDDPWGSWGGMEEEPEAIDISSVREKWRITDVRTVESGPYRAALWVRLAGAGSRIDLRLALSAGREAVDADARVLWDERSARLKLIMPGASAAEFDVPGASVRRGPCGEVPGGRWVRVEGPAGGFGFASDGLYNFDLKDGDFRATVVRASRYADDVKTPAEAEPWRPAVDCGELRFRFLINPGDDRLRHLAAQLERPPLCIFAPPHDGELARKGSFASVAPDTVELLAIKPADDGRGMILRLRETAGKRPRARFTWMGKRLDLGEIAPNTMATWRLSLRGKAFAAKRTTFVER